MRVVLPLPGGATSITLCSLVSTRQCPAEKSITKPGSVSRPDGTERKILFFSVSFIHRLLPCCPWPAANASNQQSCSQCCNAILRRHCNHRSYSDCDNKEKKQVFSSSQSSSLPFRFLNSRGCIPTPFTDLSENLIGSSPFLLVQAEQSSAVLLHKLAVHQYALPHGETAAPSWSGFFPGRSPYTWSPG